MPSGPSSSALYQPPAPCRKIVVRPVRHKIYSLHVGDEERFESNNIVFINHAMWKETRNAWQPFFSPRRAMDDLVLLLRWLAAVQGWEGLRS